MESVRAEVVRSYIKPPPNRTACDCCFDLSCGRKPSSGRFASYTLCHYLLTRRILGPSLRMNGSPFSPEEKATQRPVHHLTVVSLVAIPSPGLTTGTAGRPDGPFEEMRGTTRRPLILSAGHLQLRLSCHPLLSDHQEPGTGVRGIRVMPANHPSHSHPATGGNNDTECHCTK